MTVRIFFKKKQVNLCLYIHSNKSNKLYYMEGCEIISCFNKVENKRYALGPMCDNSFFKIRLG